ncbi:MAG: sigma-70 family RNA polymerase sigma factor [Bacteroidota bacterium]
MAFFKKNIQKAPDTCSDQELIQLYRDTLNSKHIGDLFDRYAHLVYGITLNYFDHEDDRRDAVMQVFEKLYDALKQFEISNFKCWLYSVAKNHCLMLVKKNTTVSYNDQVHLKIIQEEFMEFEEPFYLINTSGNSKEDKLPEALKKLNDDQKICIELFYLQEKSYKEVVDITNFSMNQVKSFIQNGKRNLKIMLENEK